MIGNVERDRMGKPIDAVPSMFQPSQEVKDITAAVREDYSTGHNILHTPYREFNDRSIIQTMNDDQKAFNSYISPRSTDPDESWKAQTVRPITRNKIISIAAHATAATLFPNVFAQNDDDQEDKQSSVVMRDLMEWTIRNSGYENTFLFGVIAALINPCVYLKAEFAEVIQTVKEKNERGEITTREVVDEILSGFQTHVVPVDEMLINNIYEHEIQRQKSLIRRRFINFDEAKPLWGEHENFKFVRPGIQVFFSEDDGQFYEQKDDEHPTLVEEATYYNRREDLEVTFVNGIIVTDVDQPMKHRRASKDIDGEAITVPVYPFSKSGYEPVDEKRFYFFKSAVSKLGPDQSIVDQMWNMTLDGTFLSLMPPQNIFGDEEVDSSVVIPGAANYYAKDTIIQPMNVGQNLASGYNALQALESSMSESSQDPLRAGQAGPGGRTAREVLLSEQNARIQLGLFGKMIIRLVKDFGELMMDDIIQHMSVGEVEEIIAGQPRINFRTFLLPDQTERGRKITKRIEFTEEMAGEIEPEEEMAESFEIMRQEGGIDSDTRIYKVNPFLFSQLKFKITVDADTLTPKIEELEKALKLEAYDRMIQNPLVDQNAITRDFLVETFAKGETDKYMKGGGAVPLPAEAGAPAEGGVPTGPTSPLVQQVTGSNSLTQVLAK